MKQINKSMVNKSNNEDVINILNERKILMLVSHPFIIKLFSSF